MNPWLQIKDQWKNLRDIPFPKLGKRSKTDDLIGSDYNNLLFAMKEVHGGDMNLGSDCVHWGGQQLLPLVRLRALGQLTLVT